MPPQNKEQCSTGVVFRVLLSITLMCEHILEAYTLKKNRKTYIPCMSSRKLKSKVANILRLPTTTIGQVVFRNRINYGDMYKQNNVQELWKSYV